jgi:hypothetical protein
MPSVKIFKPSLCHVEFPCLIVFVYSNKKNYGNMTVKQAFEDRCIIIIIITFNLVDTRWQGVILHIKLHIHGL